MTQVAYTAVMARLLAPADFGLMAAALVGLRFVTYISTFGLGSAIVQRPDLDDKALAVALTLSLVFGGLATLLGIGLSQILAAIAGQPKAGAILRWMAVGLFVGSVAAVPEALLRRRLQFRLVGICRVTSLAVSYLAIGIPLATQGWGANSLVAAALAQTTLLLLTTGIAARLPLQLSMDRQRVREIARFGGLVTATGFLEFLASNLDTLAVSRWVGSAGLGQYSRATSLVGLPVEQANAATSRVLIPALSRVQSDGPRFARAVVTASGLMASVVIVPVAAAVVAAPELVSLVLGPGWAEAASVLPYVGAAYGLSLLTHLPAAAAEARGLVRVKFSIQVATLAMFLCLVALAVTTEPSLHRFAMAWLASELFRHVLYWIRVLPQLDVHRPAIAHRYAAAVVPAVALAAPLFVSVRLAGNRGVIQFALWTVVGLVTAAVSLLLPPTAVLRRDLRQLWSNVRQQSPGSA